jgi:hypothetical protein
MFAEGLKKKKYHEAADQPKPQWKDRIESTAHS